jgi:hypothetical protein
MARNASVALAMQPMAISYHFLPIRRQILLAIANGKEAHEIYKIGTFYKDVAETLAMNGFAPNRKFAQKGFTQCACA